MSIGYNLLWAPHSSKFRTTKTEHESQRTFFAKSYWRVVCLIYTAQLNQFACDSFTQKLCLCITEIFLHLWWYQSRYHMMVSGNLANFKGPSKLQKKSIKPKRTSEFWLQTEVHGSFLFIYLSSFALVTIYNPSYNNIR